MIRRTCILPFSVIIYYYYYYYCYCCCYYYYYYYHHHYHYLFLCQVLLLLLLLLLSSSLSLLFVSVPGMNFTTYAPAVGPYCSTTMNPRTTRRGRFSQAGRCYLLVVQPEWSPDVFHICVILLIVFKVQFEIFCNLIVL